VSDLKVLANHLKLAKKFTDLGLKVSHFEDVSSRTVNDVGKDQVLVRAELYWGSHQGHFLYFEMDEDKCFVRTKNKSVRAFVNSRSLWPSTNTFKDYREAMKLFKHLVIMLETYQKNIDMSHKKSELPA